MRAKTQQVTRPFNCIRMHTHILCIYRAECTGIRVTECFSSFFFIFFIFSITFCVCRGLFGTFGWTINNIRTQVTADETQQIDGWISVIVRCNAVFDLNVDFG